MAVVLGKSVDVDQHVPEFLPERVSPQQGHLHGAHRVHHKLEVPLVVLRDQPRGLPLVRRERRRHEHVRHGAPSRRGIGQGQGAHHYPLVREGPRAARHVDVRVAGIVHARQQLEGGAHGHGRHGVDDGLPVDVVAAEVVVGDAWKEGHRGEHDQDRAREAGPVEEADGAVGFVGVGAGGGTGAVAHHGARQGGGEHQAVTAGGREEDRLGTLRAQQRHLVGRDEGIVAGNGFGFAVVFRGAVRGKGPAREILSVAGPLGQNILLVAGPLGQKSVLSVRPRPAPLSEHIDGRPLHRQSLGRPIPPAGSSAWRSDRPRGGARTDPRRRRRRRPWAPGRGRRRSRRSGRPPRAPPVASGRGR
mmetsp:Transcript_39361/g.76849  ORF Transcript_39361/g.76849 Transcript_39361/m.76849 type:complete len:360 (+) Transcript_39361:191-1270(+)